MKEPKIVEQLREEEKKGLLKSEVNYFEKNEKKNEEIETNLLDLIEKSHDNISDTIKLEDFEKGYKKIFENFFVAITIADEKERIISWNKYAEKLFKMDEKDLFLRNVSTLYPPDEWDKIRAENIRKKGMKYKMETKLIRKNGKTFNAEISLCILKSEKGKPIGSIGIIKDTTPEKKIKKELNSKENLLQSLLDNIPDCIYIKDDELRYLQINKATAEEINKKPEEIIGKTDFDIYPKSEAERNLEEDKKVIQNKEPIINKVNKINNPNGEKTWVSVTKIPRYDKNGKVTGLIGINREITKIKESKKKYKKLFEAAIDPIIILDKKGRFIDINKQVTDILGYKKDDLLNKSFSEVGILDEGSKNKVLKNFKKRMMGKKVGPYEINVISKDQEIIPAEVNASPVREDSKLIGDLVILRDLRERYKSEKIQQELNESQKKFKDIFDATSDFLIYLEKNIILDINESALNLLDLKKEEIIGKRISCLKEKFSEEAINKHEKAIDLAVNGKKVNEYQTEISINPDYDYQYLFSVDQIKYDRYVKGLILRGRDITQRQRAWNELVKLEEKYRVLAETSADGVITLDNLGRLTYVNPSFEKMVNKRKCQILATLFRDYLSDDSVYYFQQLFIDARKKKEKIENVELELTNNGEDILPIEVNISPVEKNGNFAGLVCTIRDITERRKVEEELKKSERLKTEFMNIAAHELKSPVTPIKGYLDLIISDENTPEQTKKWAKVSLRNSERLLRLVNDILDVSRLDTDTMRFDMEKLSPVEILDEIVEDMKATVEGKGLKFITEIPRNLPNVMGDRYRLSQILKNLLVNALKFTDNGFIKIKAKKTKDFIEIIVQDTGIGISKQEIKKVFNKFYQAYTGDDRKNEGTGLGLFICKQIIEKHKGDITLESEIGKGCTFYIKIPYIHKMVVDLKK